MSKRRSLLFVVTVGAIIAADQVSKAWIRSSLAVGESRPIVDGFLWLTHVNNTGAAFGMLRGQQWFLISVAVVVLLAIAYATIRIRPESVGARTALAMVFAGAVGNLIDRVAFGGVTDFLDLGWWPVFNVADISLDIGVALLVWWLLFGSEHSATPEAEPSAGLSTTPVEEEASRAE